MNDRPSLGVGDRPAYPRSAKASAVANARLRGQAAGYFVREGSYQGTPDDCLGRWYIGRDAEPFRPWGKGHASQGDAWLAIAEHVLSES